MLNIPLLLNRASRAATRSEASSAASGSARAIALAMASGAWRPSQ